MAAAYAVMIAAFLQIILRISFVFEQSSDMCSTAPTLASWIFLIAFFDIILDICIYPVRYMHLPYIYQFIIETIVTVLLTEFSSLVVWCTIEKNVCKLSKYLLMLFGMPARFYYTWENYILGIATTGTSVAILCLVVKATDNLYFLRRRSLRMCHKINSKLWEAWYHLQSVITASTCNNSEINCASQGGQLGRIDLNNDVFYQTRMDHRRNRSRGRKLQIRSRSRNRK